VVALLVVLLLALPLVELVVIIKVGEAIGAVDAVALLVLVSLLGVWLVKRQGLAVLRRAQREVDAGRVPTASLLDGVLLLIAGGLLIFPGFVSDVVGLLLLLPPVRYVLRQLLVARYGRRVSTVVVTGSSSGPGRGRRIDGRIVDVDSVDVGDSADPPSGPSGPADEPPPLPGPS
jgi:UPF0716 protein FxsA